MFEIDPARIAPIRYDDVPGPRGLPFLGNALQVESARFHRQLEDWAKEYGETFTFRITNRRMLVVTGPDAIASVLRRRPDPFRKVPRLVRACQDLGMHGVFSANGEDWKRQRLLVMPALDPAHLHAYLPQLVGVTGRLRAKWSRAAASRTPIHLESDLMRYTVDVTTGLAFGHDLNTLEQGDDAAIQRHLNVILPELFRRLFAPVDVRRWLPSREVTGHVKALGEAIQGFIDRTRRLLAEQPHLRAQPQNLIQSMVATCDAGGGLSDDELSANVLTMLLAGEDTTATMLSWVIWLLASNRGALARAREEVDTFVGPGRVATSIEQLSRLDYVEACANESARIEPVAPIITVEAGEDAVVDGVMVPAGTLVLCLMSAAGADPFRFDEPEVFRAERWLRGKFGGDAAPAASHAGMLSAKRAVMPFGAGPRVCPGRYLALAQVKMVVSMLLANFNIDEAGAPGGEPRERLAFVLRADGLQMRVSARSQQVALAQ